MMRSLRAFFLGRVFREKLLLLVFVGFGTLIWLSSFAGRATQFWREQKNTTMALKTQQQFLDNRARIEAELEKAADQLVAAKTLDKTRLVAEVNNLSTAAGFHANTAGEPVTTTTNGQFSIHTYSYQIRNVAQSDWLALQKFYVSLRDRSPYIGIDQFTLSTSPTNRTQLTLLLKMSSFEVIRSQ